MSLSTSQRAPLLPVVLVFTGIFSLVYVFSLLMPAASDDFLFRENLRSSYTDIFYIIYDKYMHWDGRAIIFFINHTLLYLPPAISSAVQATIFCLLLLSTHVFVYASAWREALRAGNILCIAALLWAGIPALGAVIFWKTAVGLSLLATLFLLFLLPVRLAFEPGQAHPLPQTPVTTIQCIAYGCCALLLGAIDYSIPTAFAGFVFCILFYCRLIRHDTGPLLRVFFVAAVALVAGALIALLAPGNFARAGANPEFLAFLQLPFREKLTLYVAKIDYIHSWFILPYFLLAWGVYVLARAYGRHCWRHFPFWGVAMFCIAQAAAASFIFSPITPKRTFTSIFILMLVAGLLFLQKGMPHAEKGARRVLTGFKILLACYCLLSIPYEIGVFRQVDAIAQQRLDILNSRQGQCLPPYPVAQDRYLGLGEDVHDVQLDPAFWLNKELARIWELPSVTRCRVPDRAFLPSDAALGIAAWLSAEERLRVSVPAAGNIAKAELFYPAKLYDLMNPTPLLASILAGITDSASLRPLLVPLLYKRELLTLRPDGEGRRAVEQKWEHIQPWPMHIYLRLHDTNGGTQLVRLDEKRPS